MNEHPGVALLQRAAADGAKAHALQVVGQCVVGHAQAAGDAAQVGLNEIRIHGGGVIGVEGLELHAFGQALEYAGVGVHGECPVCGAVIGAGADHLGMAVWRGEEAHF